MTTITFRRGIASMASVLPVPIRGLIALWQARSALVVGAFDRSVAAAKKGIAVLPSEKSPINGPAAGLKNARILKAALTALLATAQKGLDAEQRNAKENFKVADLEFTELVASGEVSVAPFLSDYFLMLSEFRATERTLETARKLRVLSRALLKRDRSGTLAAWLSAVMLSPTPRMIMQLGSSLQSQGDSDAAFEAFIFSAGLAVAGNDRTVATEAVESALAIHPGDGDTRSLRGVLLWLADDVSGAQKDFAVAVEAKPEDIDIRLALARAHLKVEAITQAVTELNLVLSRHPNHPVALALRGEAHLRLGDDAAKKSQDSEARVHWEAAVADLTAALGKRADHAAFWRCRAIASYRLTNEGLALSDLEQAVKLDPDDIEAHGWRAAVLLDLKRDAEALDAVNVAMARVSTSTSPGRRAWLLGLKGRALLGTKWTEQAISALEEAVGLEPTNSEVAGLMIRAYRTHRNWRGLAESAKRLQNNRYDAEFLFRLRKEEIAALRNLGDYKSAFETIGRAPVPPLDHPDIIWLHARLLADVGDFEGALAMLPEPSEQTSRWLDHVSLRGWVIQNLEPKDLEERTQMAGQGCRLYEAALQLADVGVQKTTETVWLHKGLANALLRSGAIDESFRRYKQVIGECEVLIRSTTHSTRILALIGWCHHCIGDNVMALRYYDAAIGEGEQSIAVEFDRALVAFAAAHETITEGGSNPLNCYRSAFQRAVKENVLTRIGLIRVALHDLRGILFRTPDLPHSGVIGQMLCLGLLDALAEVDASSAELSDHLHEFLSVVTTAPLHLSDAEQQAVGFAIEASRMLRTKGVTVASALIRKAAEIYSRLNEREWAARLWRSLALQFCRIGEVDNYCDAAWKSLEEGLYMHDADNGVAFVGLVTRNTTLKTDRLNAYQALLAIVFSGVGPDRAFLDAPKIVEGMMPEEKALFAKTILTLFPFTWDERWIYLVDERGKRQIPNNDRTLEPFLPHIGLTDFANAREEALRVAG
jgi:tetratricopeptide (TPR) repeat protein